MAEMYTPAVERGWKAEDFKLQGTDEKVYTLDEVRGKNGLVVMFICNHCPYVKAVLDKIISDTKELKAYGINSVAIMSNDPEQYPEDSFRNMQTLSIVKLLPFPYLWDKDQSVARTYGAVCTPDFFGFNADLKLQYRGRLDASGRSSSPEAKRELFEAMVEISKTGKGPDEQMPSIGCSIKWK